MTSELRLPNRTDLRVLYVAGMSLMHSVRLTCTRHLHTSNGAVRRMQTAIGFRGDAAVAPRDSTTSPCQAVMHVLALLPVNLEAAVDPHR